MQFSFSKFKIVFLTISFLPLFCFFSCKSLPQSKEISLSRNLLGKGQLTPAQLAEFFFSNNHDIDKNYIQTFAKYYVEESGIENINHDVAFAQMCLETGYLRFGGLVKEYFHNYCGLGSIDALHPGEKFKNEQTGIRAHIQHLQAYATKEDVKLNQKLVDPRYSWIHKSKYAENIWNLAGTWATDPEYGNKINSIMEKMENFIREQ